ncbi:MAG: glycosyltransferase family 39 protein [Bdellovibrionota bacterium]
MPNRQHTTPTRKETSLVTWIALSVVLVAAGLLRLYKIELQSFSIDESSSLMFSGSPDWRALFWDNNPPLYHIILRAWLTVAPMTEFAVRSLSVVPGILGTYFMYRIGRDTGSASRGWLLAVLFATSGLSIRYAQEARMYSLLEFASVFHLWTLVQYENTQNERTATAFGLSHFLLGLTHLTGLMSGAFGLIHLLRRFPERRRMFVPLAFAAAIVCVVVAGFNIRPENLEWQRSIRSAFGIFYTPADVDLVNKPSFRQYYFLF